MKTHVRDANDRTKVVDMTNPHATMNERALRGGYLPGEEREKSDAVDGAVLDLSNPHLGQLPRPESR